ncbi:hypothetical protein FEF65_06800 [Mariprofundus erugo]|uniref:Uncharacterized protein n=1 Tax=Mariprofundus erugo TaxID=2528639 RepID=A0A5R9GRC7_9PROT|nr:hypothetical protein [Mariprofundus erugo]TLS67615.1 hypothetical protein FEF65_06800 [Mariprofundus erugo]
MHRGSGPAAAYTPLLLLVVLLTSAQCTSAQTSAARDTEADLPQSAGTSERNSDVADAPSPVWQPQLAAATPMPVPLQPVVIINNSWHAPALTPDLAREARIQQQRERARTVRMAERAFYFGIDADNNALK